VKDVAKRLLASGAAHLPWGARQAIYEALAMRQNGPWAEIRRFAREVGITGLIAEGESGIIQGDAEDTTILPAYARQKTWASGTNQLFIDLFRAEGGTYLDIGANIGLTTIPIARNATVSCYAFEPDPTLFWHLSENVRRNCPNKNVEVHRMAIGAESGTLKFGVNPKGNRGDNRIIRNHADAGWPVIEVPAERLDQIEIPDRGLLGIKIDTQGYEPFVIRGGAETLSRADLAVLEFAPFLMVKTGGNPAAIIDLVRAFDLAAIKTGESDRPPEFTDAQHICDHLSEYAAANADNADNYLDVVLRRGKLPTPPMFG
jgi:FkbM family methyltransferase